MIAFGALLAVLLIRILLHPTLGHDFPYQFFYVAALLICFITGIWPAMFLLVAGALLGNYYFVEPEGKFSPLNRADWLYLSNYFVTGFLAMFILEWLQRSRYEAELLLKVSESRYDLFLDREQRRASIARQLKKALGTLAERPWESPNGTWLKISDTGDYMVNVRRFRYEGLDVSGPLNWRELIPDSCRGAISAAVKECMETGDPASVDLLLPGAVRRRVELQCIRESIEGGHLVYLVDARPMAAPAAT